MNERLRELAEQATTYIEPTSNSGEGWIFDKEKFAELIILDCDRYARSAWEHGPLLGGDLKRLFAFEKEEE
jgi:hypothetical protein